MHLTALSIRQSKLTATTWQSLITSGGETSVIGDFPVANYFARHLHCSDNKPQKQAL
jgi:hypothetical protein